MKCQKIKIMIVDNEETREKYRTVLEKHPSLCLVAETDNQGEALYMLEKIPIDALILGLEIQNGSGILLLQKLQAMNIQKPFVEVVTNVISRQIYEPVKRMGADYICSKSSIGDAFDIPLSILELCMSYRIAENVFTRQEMYRQKIRVVLKEMGFPDERQGTAYLEEGILYMALAKNGAVSTTKELYPYIAGKFQVNVENVERSIRLMIEWVWTRQDIRILRKFYDEDWNIETGRPANTRFIKNIARKVTA